MLGNDIMAKDSGRNTTFTMKFDVTGTFTQWLKIIDEDLTPEDIVAGLNTGKYITSMLQGTMGRVEDLEGKTVATIQEIDVEDHTEYRDFEIIRKDS